MTTSSDRILSWLESVLSDDPQFSEPSPSTSKKRRRQQHNDRLLSPPVSLCNIHDHHHDPATCYSQSGADHSDMSPQTPKKRRLDTVVAGENEETPRPQGRPQPTTSLASSDAISVSSCDDSQASGHSSPSKMFSVLGLNPKGVDRKAMDRDDPDMPNSLAELVAEVELIATSLHVVPAHLESQISRLKTSIRSLSTFYPHVYAPQDTTSPSEPSPDAYSWNNITLDEVMGIVEDAKECDNTEQDEAGWNNLVHTPLLRATHRRQSQRRDLAGFCPCMSAKIIPSYRIDHLPGKKVDYVLFIDPDGQDSQQGAHEAVQTLREKLQENSINHSSFPPLRERPVTVSIETKRGGDHEQKARLQMGVWQASQWKLLSELAGAGLEELPLIPGIVVQGHQWRFVATSHRDGKTILWTDRTFGTTQTILGTFQILAGIYRLKKWSLEVFWPWYKIHVLQLGLPP